MTPWMAPIHSARSASVSACSVYTFCGDTTRKHSRRPGSSASSLMVAVCRSTVDCAPPLPLPRWYCRVPLESRTKYRRFQSPIMLVLRFSR